MADEAVLDRWNRLPWLRSLDAEFPGLASVDPPSLEQMQCWLDSVACGLRLERPGPRHTTYESVIARGSVPVRVGSWHDVFNALTFARFPKAKRALHARVRILQELRIRTGVLGQRSPEEDALTVIDEAVLIITGGAADLEELDHVRTEAPRDLEAFDRIVRTRGLRVVCFGHALYEHLVLARPVIGAGIALVAVPRDADLDEVLARQFSAGTFTRPAFTPTVPWPDPIVDAWVAFVNGP